MSTTCAFVAAWEFECCGEPIHVGDVVTVQPALVDGPSVWDRVAPTPVRQSVGHHDLGRPERDGIQARVERIWEAWAGLAPLPEGGFEADDDAHLIPCGHTSPHSGSADAIFSPVPKGARPGDEHWGWVLEVRAVDVPAEESALERMTLRPARGPLRFPPPVTRPERSEDALRELRGDR